MNLSTVRFETSFGSPKQFIASDRPEIVFTGRSNVGKSSLINKLCNQKNLAKTSSVPGKTFTINFFAANDFRLVDLPGYGYSKRAKSSTQAWDSLMDAYFSSGRNIVLAVALMDIRHGAMESDLAMIDYLEAHGINYIIAATKSDKLNKTEFSQYKQAFPESLRELLFPVSVHSSQGIEELKSKIGEFIP